MTTDAGPRLDAALASRVNWLRAGVLGANDGIVSIAGLVFGVAGATSDSMAVLIAGAAGMVAGALSMDGAVRVGGISATPSSQPECRPTISPALAGRFGLDGGVRARRTDSVAGGGVRTGAGSAARHHRRRVALALAVTGFTSA